METKMLFGVGLVFDTPEFGTIVMGANEELDELTPSTIKEMIGDQIIIKKTDGEEQVFEVVSTQINHSIAGKKISVYVWVIVYPQTKYLLVQLSTVIHQDKLINSAAWVKMLRSSGLLLNLLCPSLLHYILYIQKASEVV